MLRGWLLLSIMISKDLKLAFDSCAWQLEFHLIIESIDVQVISRLFDVVELRDGRHGIMLSSRASHTFAISVIDSSVHRP